MNIIILDCNHIIVLLYYFIIVLLYCILHSWQRLENLQATSFLAEGLFQKYLISRSC